MFEELENIDDIMYQVSNLVECAHKEINSLRIDLNTDFIKGAASISFRLGYDYFKSAEVALLKNHLVSGTSLVRSSFENMADLFYIYDKPNKYPEAYVKSMTKFNKMMMDVEGLDKDTISQSRLLRQANKWTNASIEDRIKATGRSLVNVYDLMSYFSHPNPAALVYLNNPILKRKQINILKQSNCLTVLTLQAYTSDKCSLVNVDIKRLELLANQLGTSLINKIDDKIE